MVRLLAALLAAASSVACSTTNADGPACTNVSGVAPYGDAGVLPTRALPVGYPCAAGAACSATIDDCADWPDASPTPLASPVNATSFACDCPNGVWECTDQESSPPVCASPPPTDAGPG